MVRQRQKRERRWVGLGVVLALVAAACSDSAHSARDTTTSTTAATTTTSTTIAGSAGCGGDRPETDARRVLYATLESSGGTRSYLVYVPESYDPATPAPVAYVFHGAGSNKEQQLAYSNFMPYADADGALLVLPDALGSPPRWSPYGPQVAGVEGVNDLVLFDDLSAAVEATLCVDPARVLVSGMSSGGFMAASIGCSRSDQVTTVGPVTATIWVEPLCSRAEPVPYVYFHGTDDLAVPYDGGPNTSGPVPETSQAWAEQNGCPDPPTDERIGTEVVHRSWAGCTASTDLYTVEGGGHTWPGSIGVGRLGHTTQDVDATEIIWETFRTSWP